MLNAANGVSASNELPLILEAAWILPHCLSTEQKVQIVEFDVSKFIGGIINPEMDKKPSDVSREIPIQPYDRQIKVSTTGIPRLTRFLWQPKIRVT